MAIIICFVVQIAPDWPLRVPLYKGIFQIFFWKLYVLSFTFLSAIHIELIFVYGIKKDSFLKKTILSLTDLQCHHWHKSGDYECEVVFKFSIQFHWSVNLSLCHYYIILITVATYSLISGIMFCFLFLL